MPAQYTSFCPPAFRDYFIRLNPDGSEDLGFTREAGLDASGGMTLQPDGKILIDAWRFDLHTSTMTHEFARLNQDGTPDSSFNPPSGAAGPLAVQPDGKIIAGWALSNRDGTFQPRIVRLNPDGRLDETFSPIRTGGLPSHSILEAANMGVILLPDSKLLLTGWFSSVNGVARWHMARFMGDAPVIIEQPLSRTNLVGRSARLAVIVSGAPPLSYQWYKDDMALSDSGRISGATTDTLLIRPVQFRDAGSYIVQISSASGSTTSLPASLEVAAPSAAPRYVR